MPLDQTVKTATQIRAAVVAALRTQAKQSLAGYYRLENRQLDDVMDTKIDPQDGSTSVFQAIDTALSAAGIHGDRTTIGDVMRDMGYHDPHEAFDAAHTISCHCNGYDIDTEIAADRIERLDAA